MGPGGERILKAWENTHERLVLNHDEAPEERGTGDEERDFAGCVEEAAVFAHVWCVLFDLYPLVSYRLFLLML